MIKNETVESYDKYAKHYLDLHSLELYKKELQRFYEMIKGKKIIDIGCGPGIHTPFFLEKGVEYIGIDVSRKMIEIARKNFPQANFKQMSFYELDFPKESFGGFWSSETLLHVQKNKISQVLRNIRKIIKNNGVGFISIQEKDTSEIKTKGVLEEGIITQSINGELMKRYIAFYAKQEFNKTLKDNGFKVTNVYIKEKREWVKLLCYLVQAT